MIYFWLSLPILFGFVYLILNEKYPDLEDRLSPIMDPLMHFIGYVLGIVVIIALVWGMLS